MLFGLGSGGANGAGADWARLRGAGVGMTGLGGVEALRVNRGLGPEVLDPAVGCTQTDRG